MTMIQRIDTTARPALTDPVAPEKIVSGRPVTGTLSVHEDETRGLYAGLWASDVGCWRVDYAEDETCVILEGRVRLTGDDGEVAEFGPGEAFVIPRGFKGTWETLERLRKVYTIVT